MTFMRSEVPSLPHLTKIIESGSMSTIQDLDRTIQALDRRILALKKSLSKGKRTTERLEELHRANIFRDEFDALRKIL